MQPDFATTPTQYAFAICLLLVGPLFGVIAASVQHARDENPWRGFMVVGAASWAGWIVSGVAAGVLFPRYPAAGVSESVAMLFVLPGFTTGGVALRWLATRKPIVRQSPRRRLGLGAAVFATLVLSVLLVSWHIESTTWPARRELPDNAVIVREHAMVDNFLGDFSYELSARMSEASFHEWMVRLEVEQTNDPHLYGVSPNALDVQCGSRGSFVDGVGVFRAWCM